jgi:hypothetical protein
MGWTISVKLLGGGADYFLHITMFILNLGPGTVLTAPCKSVHQGSLKLNLPHSNVNDVCSRD